MKGLKELLEKEKIKIERNTRNIVKYGRVNFTDEDNEITSIKDYEVCSAEEDYDKSYVDYTVVKGGVVLMQNVSAATVDVYLQHLVEKHPEAFVSNELSLDEIKKVRQIVKRLKDNNVMPWYIEISLKYEDLIIDGYFNKEELDLLNRCGNLYDIIKDEYIGFMDANIYIPEEVYDAYKEARRNYDAAKICMSILNGILNDWYAHVIFNWIKKFTKPREAAYALYIQDI